MTTLKTKIKAINEKDELDYISSLLNCVTAHMEETDGYWVAYSAMLNQHLKKSRSMQKTVN
jgi:hypothetical protein